MSSTSPTTPPASAASVRSASGCDRASGDEPESDRAGGYSAARVPTISLKRAGAPAPRSLARSGSSHQRSPYQGWTICQREIELAREGTQPIVGEEALGRGRILTEAEPRLERGRSLAHHRRASRSVAIDRRIHDDEPSARAEHPQALTQGRGVVGGVVERRVVDREIDAGVRERQAIELGLNRQQGPIEVAMRTEAVVIAGQQVDGGDAMPATRQPIREPAYTAAEVDHVEGRAGAERSHDDAQEQSEAARPDRPLPSVPSRQVPERQREQLLGTLDASSLGAAHDFVAVDERAERGLPACGEHAPDSVFASVRGAAPRTVPPSGVRCNQRDPAGGTDQVPDWRGRRCALHAGLR